MRADLDLIIHGYALTIFYLEWSAEAEVGGEGFEPPKASAS
jgi:hypothetical protein